MNAFTLGSLIFLFVLLANTVGAYIGTETLNTSTVPGCNANDNATECNDVGQTSFVGAVLGTTVNGIPGAPTQFNQIYVFIAVFLMIAAGILIVSYFIGLIFGGSG